MAGARGVRARRGGEDRGGKGPGQSLGGLGLSSELCHERVLSQGVTQSDLTF